GLEGTEPAKTLQSGTVDMNRSDPFPQRSNSLAPVVLQWQEDNHEEVGEDQTYMLPGTSRQITQGQSQGARLLTQSMMKTRRLTALPVDIEGIIIPNADDSDLAVEIAYDHQRNIGLRKRTKVGSLTVEIE